MGRRKEVSFEEKVSLVEECLAGRLRMREAPRPSMAPPSSALNRRGWPWSVARKENDRFPNVGKTILLINMTLIFTAE